MEPIKDIAKKGLAWRLCHSFNKFLAGGIFLTASSFLFPCFDEILDTDLITGWLFLIGSFVWMVADVMEWQHYAKNCRYFGFTLNFTLNCLSTFFYLLASDYLVPQNVIFDKENYQMGINLFTTASVFLVISQMWKLLKIINEDDKGIKSVWKESSTRIIIEVFLTLGAISYFLGTMKFKQKIDPHQQSTLALFFTIGGLFYFSSGLFINKLYFWQKLDSHRINTEDSKSFGSIEDA